MPNKVSERKTKSVSAFPTNLPKGGDKMAEKTMKNISNIWDVIDGPIYGAIIQSVAEGVINMLPVDLSFGGKVNAELVKAGIKYLVAVALLVNENALPGALKGAGVGAVILRTGGLIGTISTFIKNIVSPAPAVSAAGAKANTGTETDINANDPFVDF
jgi:hypothetical protein